MFQFRKEFTIVYVLVIIVVALFLLKTFGPKINYASWILPYTSSFSSRQTPGPTTTQEQISVTIDFGDGKKKSYTNVAAQTPLEALQEGAKRDNVDLQLRVYDFGTLVEKIGNAANTQEKAWIYYVNGTAGDAASDKKELKAGDTVEWNYVKPQ